LARKTAHHYVSENADIRQKVKREHPRTNVVSFARKWPTSGLFEFEKVTTQLNVDKKGCYR